MACTPIEMHTAALLHDLHSPKIAPITHNDYYRCCLAQVVRLVAEYHGRS